MKGDKNYVGNIERIDEILSKLSDEDLYAIDVEIRVFSKKDRKIHHIGGDTIFGTALTREETKSLAIILSHFYSLQRQNIIRRNNQIKEENRDGNT